MPQLRAFDNPDWAQTWPILRDMVAEQLYADLGFVTIGTPISVASARRLQE